MIKIIFISFLIALMTIHSLIAQIVKPDRIENLKIQQNNIPHDFILRQERLIKPGQLSNEHIYLLWRRESLEKDLVQIKKVNRIFDKPSGASSYQTWYRDNKMGAKDKIEINIIICLLDSDMKRTIEYYTKEAFVSHFQNTEIPIVGDKSWIPESKNSGGNSFSIMFIKYNVFVRLYIRLMDMNKEEFEQVTETLAKTIEYKISM